jgi:hypothetical protein
VKTTGLVTVIASGLVTLFLTEWGISYGRPLRMKIKIYELGTSLNMLLSFSSY